MSALDVHTGYEGGRWRVSVEGSPAHTRYFATKREAVRAGEVLAMVLGTHQLVESNRAPHPESSRRGGVTQPDAAGAVHTFNRGTRVKRTKP
ncbi:MULTISPECIES: DUF2188 domain-containing protein [Microbacterium]|uniref:DUF2188 domain-containing protein n=1 Tax=Microbacterium wangchenii TaxID=2541726 RepID=A0ABX5SN02_9MICO|nr:MULTISPECIES: DUF2188 domain-containing protein [Microbacterium]MCK6068222.1 DUF2188 domain-containing protein [Microbacterium sp. EYE_512]QBR87509.1 DUF2188 domain-containing protein [Microbacterium wangchenii]TXK15778.1 DUF2188 domain-containing protein [Microbacterium wangchenii]